MIPQPVNPALITHVAMNEDTSTFIASHNSSRVSRFDSLGVMVRDFLQNDKDYLQQIQESLIIEWTPETSSV
jgi:hypothetical protein